MFIILEGTDASGKSTLAKEISRQLSMEYLLFNDWETVELHQGRPTVLSKDWVLDAYVKNMPEPAYANYVADRWHWGELTYATLKRPETDITGEGYGLLGKAGWRWAEMYFASKGVAQFHISQSLPILKERLLNRGDDYINVDELASLKYLYSLAAEKTHSLIGWHSPGGEVSLEDIAESIIDDARTAQESAIELLNTNYIGAVLPKYIIIVDTCSYRGDVPFDPTEESTEFLINALPEEMWRQVGLFSNYSKDGDCQPITEKLWASLGRPELICLGFDSMDCIPDNLKPSHAFVRPKTVRDIAPNRQSEYGLGIFDKNSKEWMLS